MLASYAAIAFLLTALQVGGVAGDVANPVTNSLNDFGQTVARALPNVIAALILLGIGYLVGKIAGWVVTKVIQKLNLDRYTQLSEVKLKEVSAPDYAQKAAKEHDDFGCQTLSLTVTAAGAKGRLSCGRNVGKNGYVNLTGTSARVS